MINIAFDGKKLFEWDGDTETVANIDQEVIRIAKLGNVEPQALAQGALFHIQRNGGFFTPDPEKEMMLVVWTLISMPTSHADHPDLIRDYIEVWDFSFDVRFDPNDELKFSIDVVASFEREGTA